MKKYLMAILAAFMLLISGCTGGEPLTVEEYKAETETAFKGWTASVGEWASYYAEYVMIDGEDGEYIALQKNKSAIKQKLNIIGEKLDAIEQIDNPPAEFDELHSRLMNGVKAEQKWLDYWFEACSADSEAEFRSATEKAADIVSCTDDTLPAVYMEIYIQMKTIDSSNS